MKFNQDNSELVGYVLNASPPPVAPYVKLGSEEIAANGVSAKSSGGYVTIGQTQSGNSSPNLSIGSNESLISKADRQKAVFVNSVKKSNGYVDAVPAPFVADVSPSRQTAAQGYVTIQDSVQVPTEILPAQEAASTPTTTPLGYVCFGQVDSNSSPTYAAAPNGASLGNPAKRAHYVTFDANSGYSSHI